MTALFLRVMLHVVAGLHLRREPFELLGQMIERRVLHAGEVGHHSGNHAPKIDGPLLIGIADKIDVRTDTQRLTRPACFLETSQRHVHRPAYALGRAAHGKAHPITHVDRHRNGLRPGAGHINEHRIDFEAVEPSQPRRRAVTIDRLATGIGLQALHDSYKAKGFTVVGVPSGDFGGQEYGSNAEVKQFCESKFGIKFPMAEKAVVKGPKAIPLYKWAANTLGEDKTPQWNFHKYLIGKDGRLIAAFGTKTTPTSPEVTAAVAKALATGN